MRRTSKTRGYTIVEVMIFLAISGVTFLMAASFINGKQARSEFKQSMNDINTQVRQVVGDVNNGFYPSRENFFCNAPDAGGPPDPQTTAVKLKGENKNCVFQGQVIQFKPSDAPAGTTADTVYNVLTVAARQFAPNSSNTPKDFEQARPMVVLTPDLTEQKTLQWGMKVRSMFTGPLATKTDIGAVGFFSSFGKFTGSGSGLASGAQTTLTVPIPSSALGQSRQTVADNILNGFTAMNNEANKNPDITVCFENGAGQFGSLKMGGSNGERLTTAMQIANSPAAVGCPS